MKSIVASIVMGCTAIIIAPSAYAGEYSKAVSGCKSAILEQVRGDKVHVSLGDINKKGNKTFELEFAVKVTNNNERTRMNAVCLATRSGEVLDLAVS